MLGGAKEGTFDRASKGKKSTSEADVVKAVGMGERSQHKSISSEDLRPQGSHTNLTPLDLLQCRRWHPLTYRRMKWQTTPVFLPEKLHGQRSLAGYSPWGH